MIAVCRLSACLQPGSRTTADFPAETERGGIRVTPTTRSPSARGSPPAWRWPSPPPKMPERSCGRGFATHGGTGQDGGFPGHRRPGGGCRGAGRHGRHAHIQRRRPGRQGGGRKPGAGARRARAIGLALPSAASPSIWRPADLPKEGSHYDLPIALGLLAAMGVLPASEMANYMALGELSLDGRISRVGRAAGGDRGRGSRARLDLPGGKGPRSGLGRARSRCWRRRR